MVIKNVYIETNRTRTMRNATKKKMRNGHTNDTHTVNVIYDIVNQNCMYSAALCPTMTALECPIRFNTVELNSARHGTEHTYTSGEELNSTITVLHIIHFL